MPTSSHDDDDDDDDDEGRRIRRRRPIGCVVCKIDVDGDDAAVADRCGIGVASNEEALSPPGGNVGSTAAVYNGYIGMLAVEVGHRRSGVGLALVQRVIHRMKRMGCVSVRLETEVANRAAMRLYEFRLGFIREELLRKYYLNWGDAYRLRLWLDG